MNYIQLGRNLETTRKHAGITQERMAIVLGVARTTLVAIEQGKRKIKTEELKKFSIVVGVPVDDLTVDCDGVNPTPKTPATPYYGFLSTDEHHLIKLIRHRKWLAAIEMIINFSQDGE